MNRMLEIPVIKDIREYKAKQVGPFSTREIIFLLIGGVLAYGIYYFQKLVLGAETVNTSFCIAAMTPALMFGWFKPYGIDLEKFLKAAFISNFVAPKIRRYQSNHLYMKEVMNDMYVVNEESDLKPAKKQKKKKITAKHKLY